ncbi:uncharacterized protein MCYG_07000 [Microsporum canis CBS 113480]|uniref:Uncharacterized protein n=1 Tax=Arthroderma otae (strain ATCC MYA-4605 / CBS 113480) TaxID=554155 RepID=C5FW97_ARTOC|nr:uncharacterized protein MCYG_07000 [Microsporum canis CBS 113480]EEQ34181.1 predicted protein [Microsporum canis CBS 113480]
MKSTGLFFHQLLLFLLSSSLTLLAPLSATWMRCWRCQASTRYCLPPETAGDSTQTGFVTPGRGLPPEVNAGADIYTSAGSILSLTDIDTERVRAYEGPGGSEDNGEHILSLHPQFRYD